MPAANEPVILPNGTMNPNWFLFFKFIETLQPLSDIDFPHDDTKSDVLRAINTQPGTSYTFALTDSGNYCRFNSNSATTVTVPPNSSVAFAVGTQIDVMQTALGKVTFAQGSGVTINSFQGNKSLAGQYAPGTLIKVATNVWDLAGSLIP